MDDISVLERVRNEIVEEIESNTDRLSRGFVAYYPAYRELVGIIRSLRAMEQFVIDLYKKIQES